MEEHDGEIKISTVEMHTGGEPLRIITRGYPEIKGDTILAKRRYVRDNLDHLRKLLMFEPRGHFDMYGALLVDPDAEEADLGVLFLHNEGYSTMCGHAIIALGRYAIDSGIVATDTGPSTTGEVPVFIQCPCGVVKASVELCEGKTGRVRFVSVPAFAFALDIQVETKKYGSITLDIGYGGTYYAIVSEEQLKLDLRSSRVKDIVDAANIVLQAVKVHVKLHHPVSEDLAFVYGVIVTDGKDRYNEDPGDCTYNVCVFADSQVDRYCISIVFLISLELLLVNSHQGGTHFPNFFLIDLYVDFCEVQPTFMKTKCLSPFKGAILFRQVYIFPVQFYFPLFWMIYNKGKSKSKL